VKCRALQLKYSGFPLFCWILGVLCRIRRLSRLLL